MSHKRARVGDVAVKVSPSIASAAAAPSSSLVSVKKEPVGFGCADVGDEVVEVMSSRQAAAAAAAVADAARSGDGRGVGDDDDDDCENIEFVGGNMVVAADMPHPRESCTRFPFLAAPSEASQALNLRHCPQCYCFVCEAKASECGRWSSHCNATHKNGQWKALRNSLRSPLMNLLPPPADSRWPVYCRTLVETSLL